MIKITGQELQQLKTYRIENHFIYGLFKTYFRYSNGKVAWRLHCFKEEGKKENWLALLITADLWVAHIHILMSTLEIENKPQFLIN